MKEKRDDMNRGVRKSRRIKEEEGVGCIDSINQQGRIEKFDGDIGKRERERVE